jgi:hypothetical protein
MTRGLRLLILLMSATAVAGIPFRLEIGPPVALGINYKIKGAAFAVRALSCDDLSSVTLTATGESVVNGVRHSFPLLVTPVATPGVFAVSSLPPAAGLAPASAGSWLIHVSGTCAAPTAAASTLVGMQGLTYLRDTVQVLTGPATMRQIDAALAALHRE